MDTETFRIETGSHEAVVDITDRIDRFVEGRGDGLVSVFVPHATAGVAIFETGAGSERDVLAALASMIPASAGWNHAHGSPGHGRDHVVPAFVSPSITIPVFDGRMALGTWQSVTLVDTNGDNPVRTVRLSFLAG